jgi:hypothetical protein
MNDTFSLLASLRNKTAIREGKVKFLSDRYAPKLKPYVVEHDMVTLKDEDGAEDPAAAKKENDTALQAAYKKVIEHVVKADPTDAQNTNDFSEWLLQQWLAADNDHKNRWGEDSPTIAQNLKEFQEIRKVPEFKNNEENKTDIMKYENLDQLRQTIMKFNSADARYALPTLTESGAQIIYQDRSYILWQVTDANDLVALSSFPPNDQPAWCTKHVGTAQGYLNTGPEYVAYKDGDPLFQIDPHDASGKPQFMSRHNTKMHSSKMMNIEAAELLTKVMTSGTLNEQAQKDLNHVLTVYKAPNLDDADTFEYLKEYVLVNGSAAKKDPRFLEVEQSYVKPRYTIMEPDELRQLTNRYGRTGEATKGYMDENKFVAKINQKLDTMQSYTDFRNHGPNGNKPNDQRFSPAEFGLCYRLDGLFKKVFTLFDKEHGFTSKFNEFKLAMKEGRAGEAGRISGELLSLLRRTFGSEYSDRLMGFNVSYMSEHYGERNEELTPGFVVKPYIAMITNLSKPFVKAGFEEAVKEADLLDDPKEAYTVIKAAGDEYVRRFESNSEGQRIARNEYNDAVQAVVKPKLALSMAGLTKVKEVTEFAIKMFPQEMKGRRYPYPVSYREDKIPHWARPAFQEKLEELRLLKDQAREKREEKEQTGEIKRRFSPKREYEEWYSNRGIDTPDPQDKVIDFIFASEKYSTDDKIEFMTNMKDVHPQCEQWLVNNARHLSDWRILRYMDKHHKKRWAEMEAVNPGILHNDDYTDMAYAGQRIPAREERMLNAVPTASDFDVQIAYAKAHFKDKPWPELEKKIISTFNAATWQDDRWGKQQRLANAILDYISKVRPGKRWKEIEDKMFENHEFGYKYLFHTVPDAKERIKRLMEEHEAEQLNPGGGAEKQSAYRSVFAKLITQLENR